MRSQIVDSVKLEGDHSYKSIYSGIFAARLDGRKLLILFGRGGQIRTGDPLRPRQVRYQAALRPDILLLS